MNQETNPPRNDRHPPVPFKVVTPEPQHLDGLVACHMAALPHDVITLLGRSFLRTYYAFYSKHPSAICQVAVNSENGRIMGFVVGGRPESRRYFAMAHPAILIIACLRGMLKSDRIRRRIIGAVKDALVKRFPKRTSAALLQGESYPMRSSDCGILFTIGSHPDFQRSGVGKALVEAFRLQCFQKGLRGMRLMTRQENQAANALYQKTGWQLAGSGNGFNYYWRDTREK